MIKAFWIVNDSKRFLFATFVTGDWWLVAGGWETADSHIVISSACEKSLSFAGKRVMRETRKRETCYPKAFGHRPIDTLRRISSS
ncbi:MAG: hypothetical protein MR569_02130 [Dialister sp.]|nr:hypothetical protein [Dialister sp.]